MSSHQFLGITRPISLASPDDADLKRSKALEKALEPHGVFETKQELNHRVEVLARLNGLVKDWIKELSIQRGMPPHIAKTVGGHIYTFGSYRLGVHDQGANIDALCVAPANIRREDYFSSFVDVLRKQPEVNELHTVQNAFVPLIKMNFDGINFNMTFARLELKEVSDTQSLSDSTLLRNLDPKCVQSLHGCRVADEILNHVPRKETFRLTLRAIKLWAKKHGILSNVLGYLGGISWALMVARVCQLYPNAAPSTMVQKFFLTYLNWNWPQPVLIKKPEQTGFGFPVWDPRQNTKDRFHCMPIITSAYPQQVCCNTFVPVRCIFSFINAIDKIYVLKFSPQNTTYNVSKSSLEVMKEEFRLSLAICEEIMSGRAKWDKLFETPDFFGKYRNFIVIEVSSKSKEDQLEWYGLVESKVRHLVNIFSDFNLILAD